MFLLLVACYTSVHNEYSTVQIESLAAADDGFYATVAATTWRETTVSQGGMPVGSPTISPVDSTQAVVWCRVVESDKVVSSSCIEVLDETTAKLLIEDGGEQRLVTQKR